MSSAFLQFCCKFSLKIIFYLPVNTDRPKFVTFLVFVCTSSFIAWISSIKNVSKRDAILALVAKQWMAKAILSYESQSKCAKIAIHWFGNTKTKYGRICKLNDLLLSLRDHLLKPQWQPCVILMCRLERFRYEMGVLSFINWVELHLPVLHHYIL